MIYLVNTISLSLPWWGIENQILRFPWIWSSSYEAFDAATDGTGWPVDHLCKVFLGVWPGLRVTRNGRLVSPISCKSERRFTNNFTHSTCPHRFPLYCNIYIVFYSNDAKKLEKYICWIKKNSNLELMELW